MGNQYVHSRNSRTDETATLTSSPTATSPAERAASTPPRPPGVGTAEPMIAPAKYTTATAATEGVAPNARVAHVSAATNDMSSSSAPENRVTTLRGSWKIATTRGTTRRTTGRNRPTTSLRPAGTARAASNMATTTISPMTAGNGGVNDARWPVPARTLESSSRTK